MQHPAVPLRSLALLVCALGVPPFLSAGEAVPTSDTSLQASVPAGATAGRGAGVATVTARIRPKRVRAGETFTVEIAARDAPNASSIFFHLVYDPGLVVPVPGGFVEGGWLRRNHAVTRFLARPAVSGERVLVGISRLGSAGGGGGGVACRLTFRAVAAGATAFAFDRAGVTAAGGDEIPSRFNGSTLTIRAAPAPRAP